MVGGGAPRPQPRAPLPRMVQPKRPPVQPQSMPPRVEREPQSARPQLSVVTNINRWQSVSQIAAKIMQSDSGLNQSQIQEALARFTDSSGGGSTGDCDAGSSSSQTHQNLIELAIRAEESVY